MVKKNSLTDEERAEHYGRVRHQVKNDMSVIIGFAQLLQIDVVKICGKEDDVEKIVEKLLVICQRAKKVVRNIDVSLADPMV